jgi:hypothetical protein
VAHSSTSGGYWKWNGTDVVASTGAASGTGACGANTWASTLNGDAAPTCTQPASTNLSDSSAIVKNNQANVFTVAGGVTMDNQLGLRLRELTANGTNYVEHRAVADAGASNTTYTWPATTDSRFLFSGASGALAWNQASGVGSCTNQAVTALNNNAAPTCTTITSAYTSGTFSPAAEVLAVTDLTTYATTSGTGTQAIQATITSPSSNDVLTWNGSNWINQAPGGASHNILSATHTDSTTAAVVRGDLITGQGATPKWTRLAKGAASQCLQMDGSAVDIVWGSCAGGGGTTMTVNGSALASSTGNHSDSTPAAAANGVNVKWQKDALSPTNISAYLDTTTVGTTTFGSGSAFTWTFDAGTGTDPSLAFGASKAQFTGNFGIGVDPTQPLHVKATTGAGASNPVVKFETTADRSTFNVVNSDTIASSQTIFQVTGDNATDKAFGMNVSGESFDRVQFVVTGDLGWGPGSATRDARLRRTGTKIMEFDDNAGSNMRLDIRDVANAITGFRINNAAASNRCLLGNGTNFVQSSSDCLTTDNTETLINKTFDAEATGNALGTVSYIFIDAAGCQNTTAFSNFDLPTSGAAVAACNTGTNTQQGLLDFATDSGTLTAQRKFQLPADWNSSGAVEAMVKWKTSATANDVVWQVAIACVGDAQTDDPSFTDTAFSADTAKGMANQQNDTAWTTITTTGGCTAGELAYLRFKRDPAHASDTLAAGTTARLVALSLRFRRTQ